MKRHHTPAKPSLARTTFDLTEEEVVRALVQFLRGQSIPVPQGTMGVWVRGGSSSHEGGDPFATLVVDHEEVDINATTGFGSPSPEKQTG